MVTIWFFIPKSLGRLLSALHKNGELAVIFFRTDHSYCHPETGVEGRSQVDSWEATAVVLGIDSGGLTKTLGKRRWRGVYGFNL